MERLDLCARKVIMSAMLYYSLDHPILSDAEYDKLCSRCIAEWDSLSPLRQFQLGSPEELATTGFHIKITYYGVYGALSWAKIDGRVDFRVSPKTKRIGKERVRWWNVGDFQWAAGESTDG